MAWRAAFEKITQMTAGAEGCKTVALFFAINQQQLTQFRPSGMMAQLKRDALGLEVGIEKTAKTV